MGPTRTGSTSAVDSSYVREVLDKRGSGKKLEYFVRWSDRKHPIWEAVHDLKRDIKIIDAFEKELAQQTQKKPQKRRLTEVEKLKEAMGKKPKKQQDSSDSDSDSEDEETESESVPETPARVGKQEELVGFARGLKPDKILGGTIAQVKGEDVLLFLMKWRGSYTAELVPAKEANVKCPQVVIDYYEGKLVFSDDNEKGILVDQN